MNYSIEPDGVFSGGSLIRPLTAEEQRAINAALSASIESIAAVSARTALIDALALADLYPAPTPEETAIIDAQVGAALSQYRALADRPADVVALAAAVVSWRAEL
jgi:hypothetical protein